MPRFKETSSGASGAEAGDSARMRVRLGDLAQDARPDPGGALESREPDEILDVLGEMGLYGDAREARRALIQLPIEQMKARRGGGQ